MKKIFGLLTFILIGLINFGYCVDFYEFGQDTFLYRYISNGGTTNFSNVDTVCVYVDSNCTNNNCGTFTVDGETYNLKGSWLSGGGKVYCAKGTNYSISVPYYYYYVFSLDFFETLYPQFTSLQCQTEYNLIPISSVDSNYCTTNGLCPANDCPIGTGDGNWSALYINNIQHLSAPIINVDIPEEFDWDYSNDSGEFNLDIKGYNVDTDYIAGIITTQNSKPTNEDLNNIITNVIPLFVPGLVIILFIYFVFRFLKKIF